MDAQTTGNTVSNTMFQALEFAKLGWPVIPLHSSKNGQCSCNNKDCLSPAKHPMTTKGSKEASTSPMTICEWWHQWPHANIGLATGSSSGLVVVDIDPRHGGHESWEKFSTENRIPTTLSVKSTFFWHDSVLLVSRY